MRAARFLGGERVEIVECERPEPGPGQVLVRVQGCGVCASNLPLWQGRSWFPYPRTPGEGGHEAWGEVVAHGDAVATPPIGTRVAMLSERAFAEYDVAPASEVVPLPAGPGGGPWPAERPAPGEALGCAVNIFARSGVAAGQHVAVVGVGFLGALLVRLCAAAGANVIAVSRKAFARELAERAGARHALATDGGAGTVAAAVADLTRGALCERVFEVTGKQGPLDLAAQLTCTRGRLIVAGYHQDGRREVDMQLWNWRGFDVINAHERDAAVRARGMRDALALVASGELDPSELYSVRAPLDELSSALAAVASRPRGFFKALVEVAP